MKVRLSDIQPNPFRNLTACPFNQAKIDQIKESIQATGWWENIVVRKHKGEIQLAYGHHRVEALRQLYPATQEIEVILKSLDDKTMLQMMARENMEYYNTSLLALVESIDAVFTAVAEGRLTQDDLPTVPADTPARYRRYFGNVEDKVPHVVYTADSIARFLGRTESKEVDKGRATPLFRVALAARNLREEGAISDALLRKIAAADKGEERQVFYNNVLTWEKNREMERRDEERNREQAELKKKQLEEQRLKDEADKAERKRVAEEAKRQWDAEAPKRAKKAAEERQRDEEARVRRLEQQRKDNAEFAKREQQRIADMHKAKIQTEKVEAAKKANIQKAAERAARLLGEKKSPEVVESTKAEDKLTLVEFATSARKQIAQWDALLAVGDLDYHILLKSKKNGGDMVGAIRIALHGLQSRVDKAVPKWEAQ
jgi:hypothetical protein